jgi:hypothetical protein
MGMAQNPGPPFHSLHELRVAHQDEGNLGERDETPVREAESPEDLRPVLPVLDHFHGPALLRP